MATSKPVNINTASKEELMKLDQIGKARAEIIVQERAKKGRLTLEDLKLLEKVPNTIWDPMVTDGKIVFEDTDMPELTKEQVIQELTDRVDSMNMKVQEKVKLIFEKQSHIDYLEKEMKKMRDDFTQDLEKHKTQTEYHVNQLKRAHEEQMEKMHENSIKQEQYFKEEIELRERRIKQLDEIRQTTEVIEKLSPSGIYQKFKDYRTCKTEETEMKVDTSIPTNMYDEKTHRISESVYESINKPDTQKKDTQDDEKTKPYKEGRKSYNEKKFDEPLPPRMALYDGKGDWRPYILQFDYIADRYGWSPAQRLDKVIECLRDKALKYFSVKTKSIRDYTQLCEKMNERFGKKDLPHIIRRQLQDLKQEIDEDLEEFAERTQEMAVDGYPDTPDDFVEVVAIDAFLQGCNAKSAALIAMNKNPTTLQEAKQFVKSAITNQRIILGAKKIPVEAKRVSFQTFDDETEEVETERETTVRTVRFADQDNKLTMNKLDQRLRKTEEGLEETRKNVNEILKIVSNNRTRSPNRTNYTSPTRRAYSNECYRCGEPGHFARECGETNIGYSPGGNRSRSPSPKRQLNLNGLKM